MLGRRSADDERQINRWKGVLSIFRGKLVKVIKMALLNGEFNDYSISSKIRQILLHWRYELTENDFSINLFQCVKMKCYQFNRKEILQKAKTILSQEKAAEYYLKNKEAMKEKSKNWYKNLLKEEKYKIKEYQRNRYQQLTQYKNEALQRK